MEADDKVLSIPFEDICLNKVLDNPQKRNEGKEPIGVKPGDVLYWTGTKTRWLVYSQYLQELAYFRGQMRKCDSEPMIIDGKEYYYYLKGPDEKTIDWQRSKHFIFNELNYTLEIYISKDTTTTEFFHRFKFCKVRGKNYEV